MFGVREVEFECEFAEREWDEAVDLDVDIVGGSIGLTCAAVEGRVWCCLSEY